MSINELENIKNEFSQLSLHPTYLEHEPVVTSEDAAKTRGFELRQGIKALLFTDSKNNWVVVGIPADKKVDQKKVSANRGWSKNGTRMATPEEVIDITGCEIGAVPPFGHKTTIPILVDICVFENQESAFNIGLRTNSVKIPTVEMRQLFKKIGAVEGEFTKL
jgi:prolyl-tRNA editing enzyme YbaK/EbsC (Cys-tRNA(Pro) deacylase)